MAETVSLDPTLETKVIAEAKGLNQDQRDTLVGQVDQLRGLIHDDNRFFALGAFKRLKDTATRFGLENTQKGLDQIKEQSYEAKNADIVKFLDDFKDKMTKQSNTSNVSKIQGVEELKDQLSSQKVGGHHDDGQGQHNVKFENIIASSKVREVPSRTT